MRARDVSLRVCARSCPASAGSRVELGPAGMIEAHFAAALPRFLTFLRRRDPPFVVASDPMSVIAASDATSSQVIHLRVTLVSLIMLGSNHTQTPALVPLFSAAGYDVRPGTEGGIQSIFGRAGR